MVSGIPLVHADAVVGEPPVFCHLALTRISGRLSPLELDGIADPSSETTTSWLRRPSRWANGRDCRGATLLYGEPQVGASRVSTVERRSSDLLAVLTPREKASRCRMLHAARAFHG